MSTKERLSGIWLITMNLLALLAYTVFFVAKMWLDILHAWYLALVILQGTALFIYMWGPDNLKSKTLKVLYRLLFVSSILVIPSFPFIFMGLISQYHAEIPEAINAASMRTEDILPKDQTVVYNTGTLYVFFPEYSDIDHVTGNRPSKSDESITWCSGAAFQHSVSLGFSEVDVEGDHAVNGTLYESPYNRDTFVAFTFADGKYAFNFENTSEAIKKAAEKGGSGFMQFGLIRDGEAVMNFERPRARSYRTMAELNGNLCIIDSVKMMHFTEFMEELKKLGVTNAIYMDMGAGWNYSWYREVSGKVRTLFGLPVPWSHNWVVFRN